MDVGCLLSAFICIHILSAIFSVLVAILAAAGSFRDPGLPSLQEWLIAIGFWLGIFNAVIACPIAYVLLWKQSKRS